MSSAYRRAEDQAPLSAVTVCVRTLSLLHRTVSPARTSTRGGANPPKRIETGALGASASPALAPAVRGVIGSWIGESTVPSPRATIPVGSPTTSTDAVTLRFL